jgi:thermitase
VRLLVLLALVLAALPAQARAAELIVKREPGLDRSERAELRRDAGVTLDHALTLPDTEVVHAADPHAALAKLKADPRVSYAEVDQPMHALADDPLFGLQWALANTGQLGGVPDADMDVPDAWPASRGAGVTVAVVDTGVDPAQPDLAGQLDEARAWDFVGDDADASDANGHGTHVAGTIAALAGNGIGVEGVAPAARILPIRVLDSTGAGYASTIAEGFDYAGRLGVRIVNASLGGPGGSDAITQAMEAHPDTLYVIAAGNDGTDDDSTPVFPCTSPAPNVLCVGASDTADARAWFSNYGADTVDVFAPGVSIYSTLPNGAYGMMSGTSMAAPNAAGAAALALALDPAASAAQLKAALIDSADRVADLGGLAVSGGRVNAAAAVAALGSEPAQAPTPTPAPTAEATPAATPTPTPPAATPAPTPAASPAPAPPARAPAAVRALTLSGRLRGGGTLRAAFTLTDGASVRISIARRGHPGTATSAWTLAAHAGVNRLTISRRVQGRTLARGAYTLSVSLAGSSRSAAFSVS